LTGAESHSLFDQFLAGAKRLSTRSADPTAAGLQQTDTEPSAAEPSKPSEPNATIVHGSDESTVDNDGNDGNGCEAEEDPTSQLSLAAINDLSPSLPPSAVGSLHLDNVRWYFQDADASHGLSKKTKPDQWLPFCCHDSKRLEQQYQRYLELLPAEAQASDADITVGEPCEVLYWLVCFYHVKCACVDAVSVRGGLFDVDVIKHSAR
jgi:hypothetical protein